jgi:hypothetical protein
MVNGLQEKMVVCELVAKKVGLPRYWKHCLFALSQVDTLRGMLVQVEQLIAKSDKILIEPREKSSKGEKRKSDDKGGASRKGRLTVVNLESEPETDDEDGAAGVQAKGGAGKGKQKLKKVGRNLGCATVW